MPNDLLQLYLVSQQQTCEDWDAYLKWVYVCQNKIKFILIICL